MKYAPFGKSLLAGLVISASGSAVAANSAVDELLKALYQNGTIDQATYELVKQAALAEAEQNRAQIREISVAESQKTAGTVVAQQLAKAKSSKPSVKLGGRIQLDAGSISEDNVDHNSGTEFRRVRLFAKGDLHEDWGYKLQYDFTATGSSGLQDAYLDYKPMQIRIGHAKEPFSLQNMTSSKYTTFIERSLPHVFAEGRNIGIQTKRNGDNWMIAGGIFGDGRDGSGENEDTGNRYNEGWGASVRGTIAPINSEEQTLHLGASLSYRNIGGDHTLRLRERPEAHITDTRIVNTTTFDANNMTRAVLEAAYINGPFHVQGEYYYTDIERQLSGNDDLNFSGFYVETGLFLTDDSMNYKASKGSYSRVNPTGPNGAWQIAARFSSLDLSDQDIDGGEAESVTLGLNWFATPNVRFSANYVSVLDVDGGPTDGDEPDAFTFRTQVEF